MIVKHFFQHSGPFLDLLRRQSVKVRNRIVIMELHPFKPEFPVQFELGRKIDGVAHLRPERVLAFVNVPRTK